MASLQSLRSRLQSLQVDREQLRAEEDEGDQSNTGTLAGKKSGCMGIKGVDTLQMLLFYFP